MKHNTIRTRPISLAQMLAGIGQAPFTFFDRAVRQSAFAALLILGGLATAGANPLDAGTWTQVGKMSVGGGMFKGDCNLSDSCNFDNGTDFWSAFPTFAGQKMLFITGDRQFWVVADYGSVASIVAGPLVIPPNITWLDAGINGMSLGNSVVGNLIANAANPVFPLVTLRGGYCANQSTAIPFPGVDDCNLLLWGENNWNNSNGVPASLKDESEGVEVYVSSEVDLVAIAGQWSPDGGTTQIPMWGFAADINQACNSLPTWDVGPQLTDADLVGGDLTINLRNCLSEGVSIVIPGKPATTCNTANCVPRVENDSQDRPRVRSFTTEASGGGGTMTYIWTGISDGTYLYQSGSHPAKQVQMGLYGALTIKGSSYPGSPNEVTLLYSEIDPELHSPPTAATPLGYNPSHYLVNGGTSASFTAAGDTSNPTLLRFLNAGLDFHVPALNTGYMELVAEDANEYPFPKQQYSANLAAGKTIDALWLAPADGDYVIYDRRGNGMVATLTMVANADQPVANNDFRALDEDTDKNVGQQGTYFNDTLANGGPITGAGNVPNNSLYRQDVFLSVPSNGSVERVDLCEVETPCYSAWVYKPNPDFNGLDTFTYKFRIGDGSGTVWGSWSNIATITMNVSPVNDLPVANNVAYDVTEGTALSVAALGVLVNDTDVDGDALNAVLGTDLTSGTLTLNAEGSFDYDSTGVAVGTPETFTYFANDGTVNSAAAATVSLNIIATTNSAPVAVEDFATMPRRSPATFINLTGNDSDPDGNLGDSVTGDVAPGDITITTGDKGTRGGIVAVTTNGVDYTPKRRFRGTDTFNYTVTDLEGAVSNEVTVRVNVVKE